MVIMMVVFQICQREAIASILSEIVSVCLFPYTIVIEKDMQILSSLKEMLSPVSRAMAISLQIRFHLEVE